MTSASWPMLRLKRPVPIIVSFVDNTSLYINNIDDLNWRRGKKEILTMNVRHSDEVETKGCT